MFFFSLVLFPTRNLLLCLSLFFLLLWIWLIWIPHKHGIKWCLFFCDWLVSLNIISSRFIYFVVCDRIFFFLRGAIPLYKYTAFCLSIPLSVDVWMLSCFWLLQLVLLWTWSHKYFFKILLSVLLVSYSEMRLLDHIVILFLIFLIKIVTLYFIAIVPFYSPTNVVQGFQLFCIPTKSYFFNSSHLNWCEVIFLCDLFCIFLMTSHVSSRE